MGFWYVSYDVNRPLPEVTMIETFETKKFGDLLDGDCKGQPGDESCQDGLREEGCDPPHMEQAGNDRYQASQDRQPGG